MEPIANIFIASGTFFDQEGMKDFLLITIPTLLLAFTTLWDNERMFRVVKQALALLAPKKKEHKTELHEFHGHSHELSAMDNTFSNVKEVDISHVKEGIAPKLVQKPE